MSPEAFTQFMQIWSSWSVALVMLFLFVTQKKEHREERKEWRELLSNQHEETNNTAKETNLVLRELTKVIENVKN